MAEPSPILVVSEALKIIEPQYGIVIDPAQVLTLMSGYTDGDTSEKFASAIYQMTGRVPDMSEVLKNKKLATIFAPVSSIVTVRSVNGIYTWSRPILDNNCPICKEALENLCIRCLASSNENEDCYIAVGACSHKFHLHCINEWYKSKDFCPLCNNSWQIQEIITD
jgi:RING-box protein 1